MVATMTASTTTTSNARPPVTAQHVREWASFGPPLYEKPTSPEQLAALQERKTKVSEFKQRITEELNDGKTGRSKPWSIRGILCELERQVEALKKEDTRPEYQKDNSHADNTLDHRDKGGPLLQYLWCNTAATATVEEDFLHGQTLYLGGEVGSDGNIYCIPGHAGRVLQINTTTQTVRQIGPELFSNCHSKHTVNGRLYKWLRGIVVGDLIYGLPCHADEILKINCKTHEITKLPIPYEKLYSNNPEEALQQRQCIWKYHGGTICPLDNCIYAIPQTATHVLKLDPTTEEVTIVGPSFPGRCKWYGGILGKQDGAIYGIPHNASGVLRITPTSVTLHGGYGAENHKWHGGAAATNGVIVSVPANADTVLCVTPGDPTPKLELIGQDAVVKSCGRHRDDGKYKYLGAMASNVNGKVYVFPCASEYVLQVDTVHMTAKAVGPNLRDSGLESIYQNKWQNGLTSPVGGDGCVYGMPLSGHTLLRIDCSETSAKDDDEELDPVVTTWKLPSPRIECRDKFEGGVMTDTGVMYTVPNNHKGVLRIEPVKLVEQKD